MKKEELEKFSVDISIDRVIEILVEFRSICQPNIELLKKTELRKFPYFLLSTLLRIDANVNSLIVQFPHFKADVVYKLPINLILRSIVSDYLTIEYLLTFKDPMDDTDTAIINEIKVLNLDFIKFQEAILIEELTYLKNKDVQPWSQDKINEKLYQFYSENSDVFFEDKGNYTLRPINISEKLLHQGF